MIMRSVYRDIVSRIIENINKKKKIMKVSHSLQGISIFSNK